MGRSGRVGTVRVQGRSMRPTLVEGQLLAVEFNPERFVTGDVLIFRQQDHLVVHRLLGRSRFPDGRPGLRTRGDGYRGFDPHVHRSQVIGRVTAIRFDEGWRTIRSPGGRCYARCVAWHDLFWAVAGIGAGAGERLLARLGVRLPFRDRVASADRRLLQLAHRLLFLRLHPVVAAPEDPEEDPQTADP